MTQKDVRLTHEEILLTQKNMRLVQEDILLTQEDMRLTQKDILLIRTDMRLRQADILLTRKEMRLTQEESLFNELCQIIHLTDGRKTVVSNNLCKCEKQINLFTNNQRQWKMPITKNY